MSLDGRHVIKVAISSWQLCNRSSERAGQACTSHYILAISEMFPVVSVHQKRKGGMKARKKEIAATVWYLSHEFGSRCVMGSAEVLVFRIIIRKFAVCLRSGGVLARGRLFFFCLCDSSLYERGLRSRNEHEATAR